MLRQQFVEQNKVKSLSKKNKIDIFCSYLEEDAFIGQIRDSKCFYKTLDRRSLSSHTYDILLENCVNGGRLEWEKQNDFFRKECYFNS